MMAPREYQKLHAEWYELVSAQQDHQPEIEFWERCIRAGGEPALELGSGTGRVLVPLLERGLDIIGIDTSEAMSARCRAECARRGLSPQIYRQSMLEMVLRRHFELIILTSGGLGLFTSDEDIARLFERVSLHLRAGGRFIYEYEPIPETAPADFSTDKVTVPGGSTLSWETRRTYDEATHVWANTFSLERIVHGETLEREVNERVGRCFTEEQATGFARAAGFEEITASDWLERGPVTRQSRVVTVQCSKPKSHDDEYTVQHPLSGGYNRIGAPPGRRTITVNDVEYGGFWIRVVASIIDTVLILVIIAPILTSIYGTGYWVPAGMNLASPDAGGHGVWDFLLNWVLPAVAIVVFWIYRSATPGKMVLHLRIVDAETGDPPSAGQCVGRYLAYYVSIIPFLLGFLWVAFDKRKQGFHDKLAGTVVIRDRGGNPGESE